MSDTQQEVTTATLDQRYWRQLDLINPKILSNMPIHIIGCGGIGSALAIYASKMGAHTITLWDFDKFEIHNLPNQMCRTQDIGKYKADALADIIMDFEDIEVDTRLEEFNGDIEPNTVVIMAVDSMKTRKEIWKLVKKSPISYVIDGRMGLLTLNVYSVDPSSKTQVDYYEKTLWDDEEVAKIPCTAKTTIFTAGIIASIICGHLAKLVKNERLPCEIMMEMGSFYLKKINHLGQPTMETQPLEKF